MRYSDLFGKTKRDAPAAIADPAWRLAYRAGLIRVLDGGTLAYLPLAARVFKKMGAQLSEALVELGLQELCVDNNLTLAGLAAQEIRSHKNLPARLVWWSAGGTQMHLAAVESDYGAAEESRQRFDNFATRFIEWAQVPCARAIDIDDGRIWYAPAPAGDLELFRCSKRDDVATRIGTRAHKSRSEAEELRPLEEIATPHCETIDALAQLLGVPASRTAKAVFYSSEGPSRPEREGSVIFVVVRGDLQIDEDKLKHVLGLTQLRFASDDEILRVGAIPGYASPIGVRGATIVVDDSITSSPNLVAGANRTGYHLLNTNVPRDYTPDLVTDIALAQAGQPCADGDGTLELEHGTGLVSLDGSAELDATYLDMNGRTQKPVGLSMRLDLSNMLLAYLAAHHDDKGILWNRALAPFAVHIVALNADKPEVAAAVSRLAQDLDRAEVEYLLDDRNESAGVKFNDADLIGLPMRVTIGPRTVAQGAAELKPRAEAAGQIVPLDEVLKKLAV